MGWLDKLERTFKKLAIRNLMLYITILNGVVFLLMMADTQNTFVSKLYLIPSLVMQGEVWRLVTFLFVPPATSPIWLIFALYFYYLIGSSLEREWGAFRYTLYYLIGALGTIGAAFTGAGIGTGMLLNLSLIFAFAYVFPNFQMLLFFFIPVKMKWMAWFYLAFLVFSFWRTPLIGVVTILGSALNFLIFFGKDIVLRLTTGKRAYHNRRVYKAKIPKVVFIHRCTVCGRTERDDRNLEFRYCVDCEGDHEYCMDHLHTHEHIKGLPEGED